MRGDMEPTLWQRTVVADVAREFDIDESDLWSMYCDVAYSTFEQDLRDIANENLEELEDLRGSRAEDTL